MNEQLAAALSERDVLMAQAVREHEGNVQNEMRRFKDDLARIQSTFELRLSGMSTSA